ncbi:hypothetical protein B0I33_102151 [Prauserella shujinwangii]|uniref:DUF6286 domain-containing protein n=1 Tax=Prauserella shujinwangii TaxID=1453103 RepID=A0A2T0M0B3_9PSEU|nr:DUF6286 domain-containing protein [Prauserella shujinwangii]PRX50035.1 hypothetical protein B0I33_102151 [Prauserella shujinwangii]
MIRRPRRSLPAILSALALLAAAVLVATSAIQMLAGQRPFISYDAVAETLNRARWDDWGVAVAGGVAAALGLVLLLSAALPGSATVVPLDDDRDGLDSGASRRGLRTTLRAAAAEVDGVRSARLAVRRDVVTATVRTDRVRGEGLRDAVHAALERRLEEISLAARPALQVRVRSTRSRA